MRVASKGPEVLPSGGFTPSGGKHSRGLSLSKPFQVCGQGRLESTPIRTKQDFYHLGPEALNSLLRQGSLPASPYFHSDLATDPKTSFFLGGMMCIADPYWSVSLLLQFDKALTKTPRPAESCTPTINSHTSRGGSSVPRPLALVSTVWVLW